MTEFFADRPASDSEKVSVLVRTSAQDFNWDVGYFYIQTDFLTEIMHWTDLDKFARAIERRARELGKKLVVTTEKEPNHPMLGDTILVSWRQMDRDELVRDAIQDRLASFRISEDHYTEEEKTEQIHKAVMKVLHG